FFKEGVFQPVGEAALYASRPLENPMWVNGEIAIQFGSLSTIQLTMTTIEEPDVIPLHVAEGAKNPFWATQMGKCFSINNKIDEINKIEAAKFLNWFGDYKEAALIQNLTRGVPISLAQQQALSDAGKIDPLMIKATAYTKEHKDGLDEDPIFYGNPELLSIIYDVDSKVFFEILTAKEGAAEWVERVTEWLAEKKKSFE
ncbi:hypothetical protein K8R42_03675, partial [bacterium]|nr:hypothetical protein [bacterium]